MTHNKFLIVEGTDDLFAVVGLMEHHIDWPNDRKKSPVEIIPAGGVTEILNKTDLNTRMKQSNIECLGILLDADDEPQARWNSLRNVCSEFANLPEYIPQEGYVTTTKNDISFGCWMMPDCQSTGMMETFLSTLISDGSQKILWEYVIKSYEVATSINTLCKPCHKDKALIHTWLAWQEPPGERLGLALTQKIFEVNSPKAEMFVEWFCRTFKLQRLSSSSDALT